MGDGQPAVEVREVSLLALHPAPDNPRKMTADRLEQLKRSLEADREMLHVRPLIATVDGTVVCGNQRLVAANSLGWESIPAVFVDLDERHAREWMLRDNNAYGDWVPDDLGALPDSLCSAGSDLDLLGFDERELQQLLGAATRPPPLTDPDDIPDFPDEATTRAGDLWLLGDHRVLCGDATDPHDVAMVMGGRSAACLGTDPPYGVEYEGGTAEHLTLKNDAPEGLQTLLANAFAAADRVLAPGAVFYIAHLDVFAYQFAGAVRAQGWVQARPAVIVWVKDRQVLGRGDYHSRWRGDCRSLAAQPSAHAADGDPVPR